MLIKVKELIGYKINGHDGEVGSVDEYYIDDSSWTVRYLVANTGGWLTDRQVLISPNSIIAVNKITNCIDIDLTKKQIENSPSLDSDKPVSRQFEKSFYGYYGWPQYWVVTSMWGYYPGFERNYNELESTGKEEHVWDSHLRSTKEVSGYHVQANDGEIGHVKDFIINDETWVVQYLIINTTNWFAGKKVLISPKWIDHISWQDSTVFINHTREIIRLSPEYTEGALLTLDYETQLHHYYDQTIHWTEKPENRERSELK